MWLMRTMPADDSSRECWALDLQMSCMSCALKYCHTSVCVHNDKPSSVSVRAAQRCFVATLLMLLSST